MPDWVVTTAFRGKDEVSAKLKKMGKGADLFGNKANRAFRKASRGALSFKGIVGGILTAGAVQRGLGLVRQGLGEVANEFLAFDDAITAASAKFGIFNKESEDFLKLKKTARDVGATTEFTSAQAGEGLRFLAKAGWEANAAIEALPSFVNLATASEMEFARAADIATDVMGAFGLKSDDVAENLKNLKNVNDVMSKAVNMSNIDMEDLFETMKFAGPVAKTAGVSLEKFSAMAAFIGGAGIKASLGGTALRTMFVSLAAPTSKAIKQFKKLGIEVQDAKGNLRDPIEVLKELSAGYENMGTAQKTAATNLIFGRRAIAGASVSIDGATNSLGKFEQSLIDSKGNAKKLAEFMRTSVNKRLMELKSTAIEVGFKFIDAFEKNIPGGIDAALKALREFDVKPVIADIKEIIKTTKEIYTGTKDFIENYKGLLIGIGVAIAGIKFAPLIAGVWGFVASIKVAGGVMAAFNAVMLANPVGLFIVAVAGATAGIVTMATHWDDLWRSIGYWVNKGTQWLTDLKINAFNPLVQIPKLIMENWEPIKTFFKDLFDTIGRYASKFGKGIEWLVQLPAALMGKNPYAHKPGYFNDKSLSEQANPAKALPSPLAVPQQSFAPDTFESFGGAGGIPPSQTEAQANQAINFRGRLDIAGAPAGSTVQSKTTGAPPIQTEMLGANP